jgi:hypothetical protein
MAGLRGRVPAPMIAWIRNPELARRARKLGELLRYQTGSRHRTEAGVTLSGTEGERRSA